MFRANGFGSIVVMALAMGAASAAVAGDDAAWTVSKSSGEVWIIAGGAQPVSLKQEEALKSGDTIRTGRTGRVLLKRGEETILIAPNSVIGLPTENKEGLSTTILQQAGSILLEVEKRNVKHFEVETPYLAAVVKGTQFRVSVNAASTSVDVIRGQVEVADFKSGQIAQVMPGQVATAFSHGKPGLSLSGSGAFNPIEQGKPRASSFERIMVPKTGLAGPRNAAASFRPQRDANRVSTRPGVTRISAALGEVRLNFHKVTQGLVHGSGSMPGSTKTDWNSRDAKAGIGGGNSSIDAGNGGGSGATGVVPTSGVTTSIAAATSPGINPGGGNGAANGNGFGASGAANGNGLGGNGAANGNAFAGNGNNGNGNAFGHFKVK
jgi:hypothetical protein